MSSSKTKSLSLTAPPRNNALQLLLPLIHTFRDIFLKKWKKCTCLDCENGRDICMVSAVHRHWGTQKQQRTPSKFDWERANWFPFYILLHWPYEHFADHSEVSPLHLFFTNFGKTFDSINRKSSRMLTRVRIKLRCAMWCAITVSIERFAVEIRSKLGGSLRTFELNDSDAMYVSLTRYVPYRA